MFTIKAVTDGLIPGGDRLKFYSAARILIAPAGDGCADAAPSGMVKPVSQPAELRVHLMDERDLVFETIDVGHGQFNFNTVYVLNEKGRTVQTILPVSSHDSVGLQVLRASNG